MKRLVVVESPTKARTIRGYLPKDYQVEASMGHVRDLPSSAAEIPAQYKGAAWARLGVNVEKGFEPLYIVSPDKKKIVSELKSAMKDADEVFIATDEDREGESIGWHLLEVLKPRVPVRRMVFHEITREAILEALNRTRDIDHNLVNAQETRRVLDRLVGYMISPVLWRKVAPRLSAGRVQSVAVRLLVLRERERMAFVAASYWDLKAFLEREKAPFESELTHVDGIRVATGRDFDDETGRLKSGLKPGTNILVLDEKAARGLATGLETASWSVGALEEKMAQRAPAPPFITSTLQQEASRKLGFSARRTMQVAQKLYERGFITYMRTDSTNLSTEAIQASRQAIEERYGSDFLSPKPRQYRSQVQNAQEAHEAIRPAGSGMRTRDELGLSGEEGALYDLIWKRTVASQMADARLRMVTVQIEAVGDRKATFRASGRTIIFPGFFRAYVEGTDDPEAALENQDQPLPDLQRGDALTCRKLEPIGHETRPPARYSEPALIRTLEKEGIGRPSTYATILDTIVQRGYVFRQGSQLVPTFTAFATTNLLEEQFQQLVDVHFTAGMEQALDDIAAGRAEAGPYLDAFYGGEAGLEGTVDTAMDRIDPRLVSTITNPNWGDLLVRVGKFGPYVERENGEERASLPDGLAPADVTREMLEGFLADKSEEDRVLGTHPEEKLPVLMKKGPYGPYVQLGTDDEKKPRRMSLPKGMERDDVTLATALDLLALPRTLGTHPETGKEIKTNIGRFGPYVQHGSVYASLTASDDVLTIQLSRALELLAKKEAKAKALAVVGTHPTTGEPIEVWEGRYGPYIKHQKTNVSLPKGVDPSSLGMDEAMEMLTTREAEGPKKKTGRSAGRSRKK